MRLAEKLNIKDYFFGIEEKAAILDDVLDKLQVNPEEVAFIGDEIYDIDLMNRVGLSACPLDAAYEVRCTADYICNSCGGNGVLREFAEFIIMARQKEKCLVE